MHHPTVPAPRFQTFPQLHEIPQAHRLGRSYHSHPIRNVEQYSAKLAASCAPEPQPTDPIPFSRGHLPLGRGAYEEQNTPAHATRHQSRTSTTLLQKRCRPPKPYSSYAIMLADIISNHPRGKMTLQELYELLRHQYPDHFSEAPDDGGNNSGGWRVFSQEDDS